MLWNGNEEETLKTKTVQEDAAGIVVQTSLRSGPTRNHQCVTTTGSCVVTAESAQIKPEVAAGAHCDVAAGAR